jgi:hypothetical protein
MRCEERTLLELRQRTAIPEPGSTEGRNSSIRIRSSFGLPDYVHSRSSRRLFLPCSRRKQPVAAWGQAFVMRFRIRHPQPGWPRQSNLRSQAVNSKHRAIWEALPTTEFLLHNLEALKLSTLTSTRRVRDCMLNAWLKMRALLLFDRF